VCNNFLPNTGFCITPQKVHFLARDALIARKVACEHCPEGVHRIGFFEAVAGIRRNDFIGGWESAP